MSRAPSQTADEEIRPRHVVLVFVDGLGWGDPDPRVNPCHSYRGHLFRLPAAPATCTPMTASPSAAVTDGAVAPADPASPTGSATSAASHASSTTQRGLAWVHGGLAVPLDPILGVEGIPQSATGQTTLLTGVNAQALLGQHLTGFPNQVLREVLLERSVLKILTDRGLRARFLNVYRPLFFELPRARQLLLSVTTVANLAAGNRFRDLMDLRARRAIYQEFTNQELRAKGYDVPEFTPAEAGYILGRQARRHDFLLFEYFQTDHAGHSQEQELAHRHLVRLEEFLAALLAELGLDRNAAEVSGSPQAANGGYRGGQVTDTLVVLTSDHGNIEDLTTKQHTCNPVPLMAWGPGAVALTRKVRLLSDVTPALLHLLTGQGTHPVL